jgi:hypothetical protein
MLFGETVRTSQETDYVSATRPNRSMQFGETVAVHCGNHTEHKDALRGQDAEFMSAEVGGNVLHYVSNSGVITCDL